MYIVYANICLCYVCVYVCMNFPVFSLMKTSLKLDWLPRRPNSDHFFLPRATLRELQTLIMSNRRKEGKKERERKGLRLQKIRMERRQKVLPSKRPSSSISGSVLLIICQIINTHSMDSRTESSLFS